MLAFSVVKAQFLVNITESKGFQAKEAYLYFINGSKDVLYAKALKEDSHWQFKVKNSYTGMLKVYFPETNTSINFITENSNVNFSFTTKNNKIYDVDYLDELNQTFSSYQERQKKIEQILPVLYQIQPFYKDSSDFGTSIRKEINVLAAKEDLNINKFPFVKYYTETYQKFLLESVGKVPIKNDDIIQFLNSSNQFLETSSLLKPVLMVFLSNTSKANLGDEIDKMLNKIDVETPRGQTILSELIEIFNTYGIKDLKIKYLALAKGLKCTINERLKNTINANQNTSIGSILPNVKFINPEHTNAKSLYDVKYDKKIIIIWASTCPHCEREISEIFNFYKTLKENKIEVIGFSLDTDAKTYKEKVSLLPWINDTELKGWHSSYVDLYNVQATPTFYIVDEKNKIIANPDNFAEIKEFLGLK